MAKAYLESEVCREVFRAIDQVDTKTRPLERKIPVTTLSNATWKWIQLCKRGFVNNIRDPNIVYYSFTISAIVGVILGLIFIKMSDGIAGIQNRAGILFFLLIYFSLVSLSSIGTLISERKLFIRERLAGYYSEFSYLSSKILVDVIPIRLASGLMLGTICFWISGLNHTYFVFVKFLIALSMTQMASIMICLFFSSAFKNFSEANLVAAVFFIFSIVFGGYFVNGKSASTFFKYISFLFYGFETLMVNEFKDIVITIGAAGYSVSGIKGSLITDEFGLGRFENVYVRDLFILLAWIVFFFGATIYMLKKRHA
eukprot:TRINITY_DN2808_c0_g1_i4.p1 TRINITY_DN2808_c0_g1~~TRINITY_DN2808_c0_g1_i4.p1  ORF type:complete len:313 (-),score=82.11 TRINITY_DN2808_c0_g1_i4:15-953(-)